MEQASIHLSKESFSNLKKWFEDPNLVKFKKDITELIEAEDWKELDDIFYTHIRIGTGGIRGKLGPGPNRINTQTIGEAAQALANFIEDFGPEAKTQGVVVSREAREQSEEFAKLCCEVLAANGIKTFLFDGIRSTPEVSFAIRHLKAIAGVQLTASHNPRTDNGFKFFWTYGGQVIPPLDQRFMDLVLSVKEIKRLDFEEANKRGLIQIIGKAVDESYFACIRSLSLVATRSAKIAFSPLHSSGSTNALPVLQQEGYEVTVVPEQAQPNGLFPTAHGDAINPEYNEVLSHVIALAEKTDADVAICTDPDACRIGAAVKRELSSKTMVPLTGNEIGSAMVHFILSILKERGVLRPANLVIETSVTTSLIRDIAQDFGVRIIDDLLVGFKWIGQIVENLDTPSDFVFAFEESLGYLRGDFIRDKDGAIGALTLAELVSWLKDQGKTIPGYLDEIYERYGYYQNKLVMIEMKGKKGYEDTRNLMVALRDKPPTLTGQKIITVVDRLNESSKDPARYRAGSSDDQISFVLSEDGRTKITMRPSGTQPMLKCYIQVYSPSGQNLATTKKEVKHKAQVILDDLYAFQDKVLDQRIRGHIFESSL